MDTNHGHTDRPGGFSDTEAKVAIIGVDIAALLKGLDDFHHRLEDGIVKIVLFKFSEELFSLLALSNVKYQTRDLQVSCSLAFAPWRYKLSCLRLCPSFQPPSPSRRLSEPS